MQLHTSAMWINELSCLRGYSVLFIQITASWMALPFHLWKWMNSFPTANRDNNSVWCVTRFLFFMYSPQYAAASEKKPKCLIVCDPFIRLCYYKPLVSLQFKLKPRYIRNDEANQIFISHLDLHASRALVYVSSVLQMLVLWLSITRRSFFLHSMLLCLIVGKYPSTTQWKQSMSSCCCCIFFIYTKIFFHGSF